MTPKTIKRLVWVVLLVGLLLRALIALSQDHAGAYTLGGGDTAWYLANGDGLLSGKPHGYTRYNVPFYLETIPTPPFYLLFVGIWQRLLDGANAVIAIRLMQVLAGTVTAYLGYCIAKRLTHSERGAWLTLLLLTFDPSFLIEPSQIMTETLYIFLITWGLWQTLQAHSLPTRLRWAGVGVLFGLATLTRAVAIGFPFVVAVIVAYQAWRSPHFRRIIGLLGLMLVVYGAVISTWTAYNALAWGRFVIVSNQLMPAVWRGAVNSNGSPQENDNLLIQPEEIDPNCTVDCKYQVPTGRYVEQVSSVISNNLVGYFSQRLRELATSYLQPHTTITLGGESLRELALFWFREDFSLAGLGRLVNGDNFWLKATLYLTQYSAFALGIVGMWRLRRVGGAWVIAGFIGYVTLAHVVLLAHPRYIFPLLGCFWILASGTMSPLPTRMTRDTLPT